MKQLAAKSTLIIATFLLFTFFALRGLNGGNKRADASLMPLYVQKPLRQQAGLDEHAGPFSCAEPAPDRKARCQEIERQILASTVRVEVEMWIRQPIGPEGSGLYEFRHAQSDGHATIKEGRYLVTHNHFDLPLPALGNPPEFGYGKVRLFTADGDMLAVMDLNAALTVDTEQPEVLVLDFGTVTGEGFFTAMGLPSAQFSDWQDVALQPGMTVAQLDWDGSRAHVRWVTIGAIVTQDGTARLEFSIGLTPGASGGGVFWNGLHIANNWRMIENYNGKGEMVGEQSAAALNWDGGSANKPSEEPESTGGDGR